MNLLHCQKQLECHQHILKKNLGLLRLYSLSHLDLWKPMKILASTGAKEEPMATPSISLQNLPLKIKWVCNVAKGKSFKFFCSDA